MTNVLDVGAIQTSGGAGGLDCGAIESPAGPPPVTPGAGGVVKMMLGIVARRTRWGILFLVWLQFPA